MKCYKKVLILHKNFFNFCGYNKKSSFKGFQKKSQKTPKKEIELAEKLKKQYFNEKENE